MPSLVSGTSISRRKRRGRKLLGRSRRASDARGFASRMLLYYGEVSARSSTACHIGASCASLSTKCAPLFDRKRTRLVAPVLVGREPQRLHRFRSSNKRTDGRAAVGTSAAGLVASAPLSTAQQDVHKRIDLTSEHDIKCRNAVRPAADAGLRRQGPSMRYHILASASLVGLYGLPQGASQNAAVRRRTPP